MAERPIAVVLGDDDAGNLDTLLTAIGFAVNDSTTDEIVDLLVARGACDERVLAELQQRNPIGLPVIALLDVWPAAGETWLRGVDRILTGAPIERVSGRELLPPVIVDSRFVNAGPSDSPTQALWRQAVAEATANCNRAIGEYRSGIDSVTNPAADAQMLDVEQLQRALAARSGALDAQRDLLERQRVEGEELLERVRRQLAHESQLREQAQAELISTQAMLAAERQRLAIRLANRVARVPGLGWLARSVRTARNRVPDQAVQHG